jgi:hypothetical protein
MSLKKNYNFAILFFFIVLFFVCSFFLNQYIIKKNIKNILFNIHNSHNPLITKSSRPIPNYNLDNETKEFFDKLDTNADTIGAYSALVDWPVISVHANLLPDGNVQTFGSLSTNLKGEKLDENKTIKLSSGKEVDRNAGGIQWQHHEVFQGINVDVWDYKKGLNKNSHNLLSKPIVWDSFCSVSRILNLDEVFVMGGNEYTSKPSIDWNYGTVNINIKDNTFSEGPKLNYPRWYGSTVRVADKIYIFGGIHNKTNYASIIPEVINLNEKNNSFFWKEISKAKSKEFFFDNFSWHYPKVYLGPDDNIFGISYNKLWNFNTENDFIKLVGEIPLEKGIQFQSLDRKNPNKLSTESEGPSLNYAVKKKDQQADLDFSLEKKVDKIFTGTIGAPVGSRATSVMINDEIYMMGGHQYNYMPSNKLIKINIADSNKPVINNLESMSNLRSFGNAVILPNGNIFVNGGQSYVNAEQPHTQLFPVLENEIYEIKKNIWKSAGTATMPRNYHNNSILLMDGTILITGGDTWTAEIYYPSYLFERNIDGKLILAKRPVISEVKKEYSRTEKIIVQSINDLEITKFSLIAIGSSTHSQSVEPKYYELSFKKNNKSYVVDLPKSKSLNKGVYLLMALSSKDVPSIAQAIMIN